MFGAGPEKSSIGEKSPVRSQNALTPQHITMLNVVCV